MLAHVYSLPIWSFDMTKTSSVIKSLSFICNCVLRKNPTLHCRALKQRSYQSIAKKPTWLVHGKLCAKFREWALFFSEWIDFRQLPMINFTVKFENREKRRKKRQKIFTLVILDVTFRCDVTANLALVQISWLSFGGKMRIFALFAEIKNDSSESDDEGSRNDRIKRTEASISSLVIPKQNLRMWKYNKAFVSPSHRLGK